MTAAVVVADPDPGPLARLEAVVAAGNTPSVVFQRVCEGETLRDIAKAWQIPVGRFTEWFSTEHSELYDAALKVRADQIANEALSIADEQQAVQKKDGSVFDPEVPRDTLRVKTRMQLAEKWDRQRYGSKDGGSGGGVTVVIDRSCGGEVRVGVQDAGGNKAAVQIPSTEASHA